MKNTQRVNKTEFVFARVTPAVAARLEAVAAANGRRPSEELRAALLAHLDKYNQVVPEKELDNRLTQLAGVIG